MEEKEGKMMKRRLFYAVLVLLVLPITCFAAENRGFIRLTMAYGGQTVSGGTVTLYDVSKGPEETPPHEMLEYVKRVGISGTEKKVDATGQVVFDDLPAGHYLLVQEKPAEGFYPIKPFLIRLSLASGGTQVNSVDAAPKMEPEKKLPQTGQLIWPAWIFIGAGGVFIGIGLFQWKGKKRYLKE